MSIGVDHIHMKAREEAMRANALKNADSVKANPDKDKKFLFITLGVLAAVIVGLVLCMVIPKLIAG
ncbi:MAG: hypothetical protein IKL27_02035 [Oscillospiraceae bacterium]|nr:hypothetical protein [Oscillospiraceae bacterium]